MKEKKLRIFRTRSGCRFSPTTRTRWRRAAWRPARRVARAAGASAATSTPRRCTREEELDERICPWCIADGSAAGRFGATYTDDHPLIEAGLPESIIEEVTQRTPGYHSWQAEEWKCCCSDACEYHGNARPRPPARSRRLGPGTIFIRDQVDAGAMDGICLRRVRAGWQPGVLSFRLPWLQQIEIRLDRNGDDQE